MRSLVAYAIDKKRSIRSLTVSKPSQPKICRLMGRTTQALRLFRTILRRQINLQADGYTMGSTIAGWQKPRAHLSTIAIRRDANSPRFAQAMLKRRHRFTDQALDGATFATAPLGILQTGKFDLGSGLVFRSIPMTRHRRVEIVRRTGTTIPSIAARRWTQRKRRAGATTTSRRV